MFIASVMTSAQDNPPAQLLINYPEVSIGTGDRTALGLYFTILDRNGIAVTGSNASNATIVMDTGTRYDAQVSQPTTPLHITLVLDISGSMGPAANAMKTAAIQAIEAAPEGTLFQVITFNRQINLVQDFTTERTAVINAIASANPPPSSDPNAGTCLYDATVQALAEMDGVPLPNRRTIVLFTDGRDELSRDGEKCSRATLENVLDRATRIDDRIAINTIGLGAAGAINEDELRDIARQTGGISVIGEQENLGDLFSQIINGLAAQQVARTEICEPAGPRSATLTVQAGDSLLTESITFQNPRACAIATAVPVAVIIRGVRFDAKAETISFTVEGQGLENIGKYSFDIYDRNGNLVRRFDQESPEVSFESANIPDGDITIQLVTFDFDGLILAQADAEVTITRPTAIPSETPTFTPEPTITPTPPAISATITGIQYVAESDSININLLIMTPDQISRLEVDVVDKNGILAIPARPDVAEVINIPISGLIPQQAYKVQVRTFNLSGELVSISDQDFTNPKVITPTPSLTPTPQVSANVDTIVPDLDNNRVVLQLDVQSATSIGEITIDILDANNTLVRSGISLTNADTEAVVDLTGLTPQGEYKIRVVTRDNAGNVLSRETTDFVNPVLPILTPTPTATMNVFAIVESVQTDPRQENFTITLRTENIDFIEKFRVDVIDDQQGNLVNSQEFNRAEVGNLLTLPIGLLSDGEYRLRVISYDINGNILSENETPIGYTKFTPTPTPQPPGLVEQLGKVISDQPIVGVIIAIIVLLLIFLLFWLVRSARQREKNLKQPSLPNMTGAISLSELRQGMQNAGYVPPPYGDQGSQDIEYGEQPTGSFSIYGDATNVPSAGDPNATNFQINRGEISGLVEESTNVFLPAVLHVIDSLDPSIIGKTIGINKVIFFIGRAGKRENDLNVEGDKNISREHADIIFEGGAYYIEDKPNTHGVKVNDEKISGRYPLGARCIIKLGETTVIEFEMTSSSSKTASLDF
jgi:flagellar hook assembly protein FlgD